MQKLEPLPPLIANPEIAIIFAPKQNKMIIKQDQQRVQQILFNLIGNAIKLTKQSSINIKCQRKNNQLSVKISDTGLGLAICHELIIALGGMIVIHSQFKQQPTGTQVSFSLPIKHQTESIKKPPRFTSQSKLERFNFVLLSGLITYL